MVKKKIIRYAGRPYLIEEGMEGKGMEGKRRPTLEEYIRRIKERGKRKKRKK